MGYEPSPLAPAINVALSNRRPVQPGNEQALGWNVYGKDADQVIFRDGSSFGYASVMAYDPKARAGVVVLTNQVGDVGDIARHLLRPDFPLAKPANTKHIEIALDSKVLDSYVGRYEAKGEGIFIVARENDFLTIESPADWGLPKLRIRPESQRDFFATELPVRVYISNRPRRQSPQPDNLSSERPKRRARKQTRHRKLATGCRGGRVGRKVCVTDRVVAAASLAQLSSRRLWLGSHIKVNSRSLFRNLLLCCSRAMSFKRCGEEL